MNWGIQRLLTIFAVIFTAIIFLAAAIVLTSMQRLQTETNHLTFGIAWSEASRNYEITMVSSLGSLQTYLLDGDPSELDEAMASLRDVNATIEQLETLKQSDADYQRTNQAELAALSARHIALRDELERLISVISGQKVITSNQQEVWYTEIEDLEDQLVALNDQQQAIREQDTKNAAGPIQRAYTQALIAVIVVTTFIVVVIIAVFVVIRRNFVQPLHRLAEASQALGEGKSIPLIATDGLAEVGDLQHRFQSMAKILSEREDALEEQVRIAHAAREAAVAAQQQLEGQLQTIQQQEIMIREMSIPILPVGTDTLVMPLVGTLDTQRLEMMQNRALQQIGQQRARILLLDVTGVPIIDSQVAQGLIGLVQAARLLGTRVLLVGIRPEVAQTIVSLGLNLNDVRTVASLREGLRA